MSSDPPGEPHTPHPTKAQKADFCGSYILCDSKDKRGNKKSYHEIRPVPHSLKT